MDTSIPQPKTLLQQAASNGLVQLIETLVKSGSDINEQEPIREFTPLMFAIAKGHLGAVKKLIELGADTTIVDSTGFSPLLIAATYKKKDIQDYLLSVGAKIPSAQSLIQSGIEASEEEQITEPTKPMRLHEAVKSNNMTAFKQALKTTKDVNQKDEYSKTPLMYAVIQRRGDFVLKLLEKGADPTIKDDNLMSAYQYANDEMRIVLNKHTPQIIAQAPMTINPKPVEYIPSAVGAGGSGLCAIHNIEHDDGRKLYTFLHRVKDGSLYDHNGAAACLEGVLENPTPQFCPIDSFCMGTVYPADLVDLVSDEQLIDFRDRFKHPKEYKNPVYIAFGHGLEKLVNYEDRYVLPEGYTLVVSAQCDVQTWTTDIYSIADMMTDKFNEKTFSEPTKKGLKQLTGLDFRIYRQGDKIPDLLYYPLAEFPYGIGLSGLHQLPIETYGVSPSRVILKLNELKSRTKGAFTESVVFPTEEIIEKIVNKNDKKYNIRFTELMEKTGPGVYYFPICRTTVVKEITDTLIKSIVDIIKSLRLRSITNSIQTTSESPVLPTVEKNNIIIENVKNLINTYKWTDQTREKKQQLEKLVDQLKAGTKPIEAVRSKSTERQRQIAGLRKNGKKKTIRKKHHGLQTRRYHNRRR